MKNIIILFILIVSLNGFTIINEDKCLQATDVFSLNSVSTKIVNKDFVLKVVKYCPLLSYTIEIKDENNETIISKDLTNEALVDFKIDKPYKKLEIYFTYIINGETHTQKNIDNFAVRPYKFVVELPTTLHKFKTYKGIIKVVDFENNEIPDFNITNIEISLNKNIEFQHYFLKLKNTPKLYLNIYNINKDVKVRMIEELGKEFAIIDANDTSSTNRLISGESNLFDVIPPTKSWFGVGSNNAENQTINIEIKPKNIKSEMYKKMGW